MKKVSLILGMALCACTAAFAQTQLTQFNPYAYGVEPQVKGTKVAIKYQLNSPADSTKIVIYRDNVEVGTQPVAENTVGLHAVNFDLASLFTEAGTYTFGVRVYGTSVSEPTQVMVANGTDTTALNYAFYHPKGVAVDNNPFSPNFGRLLANECMASTPNEGYHSSADKQGIYAFDPTFQPIPNGNSYVFKGGNAFGNDYAPYRIRISEDSRIFVTDNCISDGTTLWELSADLQTWTPIFQGAFDAEGVMNTADGEYMTTANSGLDVIGSGDELQILMLGFNIPGLVNYTGNGFFVDRYNLGSATSWTGVPSQHDTLSALCGSQVVPLGDNCGIAADGEGGFWFKSARANVCAQRGFCHVNAEGVVDWELHATPEDTAAYNILPNGSNGGAGITRVGDLLFVGMGRKLSGCGRMQVFEIGADATGAPELTVKYDMHIKEISTALNDFAVDYANNLYVVGNSNEKLLPVVLPYSGVVETPVNAELVKEATAIENIEEAPVVNKIFRNGQVIIVKDGVEYNVIGTKL